jgi:ADP-heptose:LPS heptosyltransferase
MRGTMLVPKDGYHDYFILAGVARRAAYVVGNDTGPTHIAAHLGCRGLALYGSHTPPLTTGIQHSRFNWLQAPQLEGLSFETVWGSVAAELGIN